MPSTKNTYSKKSNQAIECPAFLRLTAKNKMTPTQNKAKRPPYTGFGTTFSCKMIYCHSSCTQTSDLITSTIQLQHFALNKPIHWKITRRLIKPRIRFLAYPHQFIVFLLVEDWVSYWLHNALGIVFYQRLIPLVFPLILVPVVCCHSAD